MDTARCRFARQSRLCVSARLALGVTVEQAWSEMKVISERLASEYPEEDKGWGATVLTVQDQLVGDVRPALLILLLNRRKELASRAAPGASSAQVIRPVVVETLTLALLGGLLGLVLASYGQPLVVGALSPTDPLTFCAVLCLLVVIAFLACLLPAWRATRADQVTALLSD